MEGGFTPEQFMKQETEKGFNFEVVDKRTKGCENTKNDFETGLKEEKIGEKLKAFEDFVGGYKKEDVVRDRKINLVSGGIGSGQVIDGKLEMSLPTDEEINASKDWIKFFRENNLEYRKVVLTSSVSTAMHEMEHTIIDSKPGSKLSNDFLKFTGVKDEKGDVVTLLDEGIVYAFQFLQDEKNPIMKKLRGLEEKKPKNEDDFLVETRQILGRGLKDKVDNYINIKKGKSIKGKSIDEDFLRFAREEMKKMDLDLYVTKSNEARSSRKSGSV